MYRLNERNDSTELGRKLVSILNYIELYEELLMSVKTTETESAETIQGE